MLIQKAQLIGTKGINLRYIVDVAEERGLLKFKILTHETYAIYDTANKISPKDTFT